LELLEWISESLAGEEDGVSKKLSALSFRLSVKAEASLVDPGKLPRPQVSLIAES
jgi:hypothetical protein